MRARLPEPRLTPEGLEFYYRDFYDGRGGEGAGTVFGRLGAAYRGRAEMLRPHSGSAGPASWLDVGTGHGHFCNAARAVWPGTRFDGLDMGDGVREAELRGWVETGYQGQFPEFAGKLAGQYEVVSMYHYLEHTREPLAELDTAAAVLAPAGSSPSRSPTRSPGWPGCWDRPGCRGSSRSTST